MSRKDCIDGRLVFSIFKAAQRFLVISGNQSDDLSCWRLIQHYNISIDEGNEVIGITFVPRGEGANLIETIQNIRTGCFTVEFDKALESDGIVRISR